VIVHGAPTPAANRAISKLLDYLNQTGTEYLGTNLHMIFEAAARPPPHRRRPVEKTEPVALPENAGFFLTESLTPTGC
jgi:hypothetical protein